MFLVLFSFSQSLFSFSCFFFCCTSPPRLIENIQKASTIQMIYTVCKKLFSFWLDWLGSTLMCICPPLQFTFLFLRVLSLTELHLSCKTFKRWQFVSQRNTNHDWRFEKLTEKGAGFWAKKKKTAARWASKGENKFCISDCWRRRGRGLGKKKKAPAR